MQQVMPCDLPQITSALPWIIASSSFLADSRRDRKVLTRLLSMVKVCNQNVLSVCLQYLFVSKGITCSMKAILTVRQLYIVILPRTLDDARRLVEPKRVDDDDGPISGASSVAEHQLVSVSPNSHPGNLSRSQHTRATRHASQHPPSPQC